MKNLSGNQTMDEEWSFGFRGNNFQVLMLYFFINDVGSLIQRFYYYVYVQY